MKLNELTLVVTNVSNRIRTENVSLALAGNINTISTARSLAKINVNVTKRYKSPLTHLSKWIHFGRFIPARPIFNSGVFQKSCTPLCVHKQNVESFSSLSGFIGGWRTSSFSLHPLPVSSSLSAKQLLFKFEIQRSAYCAGSNNWTNRLRANQE